MTDFPVYKKICVPGWDDIGGHSSSDRAAEKGMCNHFPQRKLIDCPTKIIARGQNEYEPSIENVTYQCKECGEVSFSSRKLEGDNSL